MIMDSRLLDAGYWPAVAATAAGSMLRIVNG
jgi:hypothetical protein